MTITASVWATEAWQRQPYDRHLKQRPVRGGFGFNNTISLVDDIASEHKLSACLSASHLNDGKSLPHTDILVVLCPGFIHKEGPSAGRMNCTSSSSHFKINTSPTCFAMDFNVAVLAAEAWTTWWHIFGLDSVVNICHIITLTCKQSFLLSDLRLLFRQRTVYFLSARNFTLKRHLDVAQSNVTKKNRL